MCAKRLESSSNIKRKRISINEAAEAVEEEMASSLRDSDDDDNDSVVLSWTEGGHSSAAKGEPPQVKRGGGAPGTGVSTEKLLIQLAKEIGVIQKQV